MNKPRWRASAVAAVLLLALVSPAAPNASAHVRGHHQHSAASVLSWNETASAAYTTSKFSPPVFAVGMGYVQAAVYNAVVGIEGGSNAGVPEPMWTRLEADSSAKLGDHVIQAAAGDTLPAHPPSKADEHGLLR